jgi:Na+/H+-dicarboxylate symporter
MPAPLIQTGKIPLHWKILMGMVAGIGFGWLAVQFGWSNFTTDWVKPFGTIFINLLKLIAIPLIIVSLINGVGGLNDVSKLSKMGLKTIVMYLLTTVIAVSIGLVMVNVIRPGKILPKEKALEFQQKFADNVENQSLNNQLESGPLQFIVDLVPSNIFEALTNNSSMLQVIFFSLLFGISLILLPAEKTKVVKDIFDSLNEIVMKMIHLVMMVAPYGVFALIASLIVDVAGNNPRRHPCTFWFFRDVHTNGHHRIVTDCICSLSIHYRNIYPLILPAVYQRHHSRPIACIFNKFKCCHFAHDHGMC